MEVSASTWAKNSRTIERGPLVFALKLEERWEKGTDEKEGDYYSVFPTEDWNYGIVQDALKDLNTSSQISIKSINDKFIWNLKNAPIEIVISAKKIPDWKAIDGVAYQPVTDRNGIYKGEVDKEVKRITLIPYSLWLHKSSHCCFSGSAINFRIL